MQEQQKMGYNGYLMFIFVCILVFLVLGGLGVFMASTPDANKINSRVFLLLVLLSILLILFFLSFIKTATIFTLGLVLLTMISLLFAFIWAVRYHQSTSNPEYKEWCKTNARLVFTSLSVCLLSFVFLLFVPVIKQISLKIQDLEKKR